MRCLPRWQVRSARCRPGGAVAPVSASPKQRIILAAEISVDAADFGHLEPMLEVTLGHLSPHGITEQPAAMVGDAGYRHTRQMEAVAERGIEVLVPPDGAAREGIRPAGRTGSSSRCAKSSGRTAAAPSTRWARSGSSRSSDRSNTTGRRSLHAKRRSGRLRLLAATHNLLKLVCHER